MSDILIELCYLFLYEWVWVEDGVVIIGIIDYV